MRAMPAVDNLLRDVVIPPMARVVRHMKDDSIPNIQAAVQSTLENSGLKTKLFKGGEIAIGVGSRGIANLADLVRGSADWFKKQGVSPFIVPCMGSHGGATAEGQQAMLRELGVSEETIGCPVRSSMEVIQLGTLPSGLHVYIDAISAKADGVFVINRVKPHTGFSGRHESGVIKMLTIGLGKQAGADSAHALGFGAFDSIMPDMAKLIMSKQSNILGALATVENALDKPCVIEAIPAEKMLERDAALLEIAKSCLPALPVRDIDVLVIDSIGKNIAGPGMDPNITGRFATPYKTGGAKIGKLAVLDLTEKSKGNASGMGMADVVTSRLTDKVNFDVTYANIITATLNRSASVPITMNSDLDTFRCAIKTCNMTDPALLRLFYIRDTLTMDRFLAAPALLSELRKLEGCEILGEPQPLRFDSAGTLLDRDIWNDFPG